MDKFLLLGIFGLAGIFARYLVDLKWGRGPGLGFPYSTLFINILGCFLIGIVATLSVEKKYFSPTLSLALMMGFLGSFTTFSAYGLDTFRLIQENQYKEALIYFSLSPIVGILGTFLGAFLCRRFASP